MVICWKSESTNISFSFAFLNSKFFETRISIVAICFYFSVFNLNPTKTKMVTYPPKKGKRFPSRYFINATSIENVDEMKDLGIIFDSKMTFKPHIDEIILKSKRVSALSFERELHAPQLNLKIICTYLLPIIEYAPLIWFPQLKNVITQLEKSLRFATRTALGSPYRNDHPNYLSYDQRWLGPELISIEETYPTSVVILAHKMTNDHLKTSLNPSLALQLKPESNYAQTKYIRNRQTLHSTESTLNYDGNN